MKKIDIYVLTCDLNEENYLELQFKSYEKFIKNDNTTFNVINNSTRKKEIINNICIKNNINVFDLTDYTNKKTSMYFQNFRRDTCNLPPYDWLIESILKQSKNYAILLHPDMFFIKEINFYEKLSNKKLYFVPRYHDGIFYMWEGVVLLDCEYLNEKNLMGYLDFSVGEHVSQINYSAKLVEFLGEFDDNCSITTKIYNDEHSDKNYDFIEMWTLHDFDNQTNIINFDTSLNGHVRYLFNTIDKKLNNSSTNPISGGALNGGLRYGNKSYPYEKNQDNYDLYYVEKFMRIHSIVSDFPKPIQIDFLSFKDEDQFSFVHFKSGSGYQNYFNENYLNTKLDKLKKMILN